MPKSKYLIIIAPILISLTMIQPLAAVKCATSGAYQKCVTTTTGSTRNTPFVDTQTRHVSGTTTTISLNTSKSVSSSTSSTLAVSGGFPSVASITASLGIANSVSYKLSSTVSYTLKANQSGLYRIVQTAPGLGSKFETYEGGSRISTQKTVAYSPKVNSSYHALQRYGN